MVKICGACSLPLTQRVPGDFSVIQVKRCQHYTHYECFYDEKKQHIKVTGAAKKILCPQCKVEIMQGNKKSIAQELLGERVRKIDLSFTDAKEAVSWIVGMSIASVVMILALAIYPSIGSLAIGGSVGVLLGYKSAGFVGRYFTMPAEIR